MNKEEKDFILLGAGGHAKVVMDIIQDHRYHIRGVCDPILYKKKVSKWRGLKVLGDDSFVKKLDPKEIFLANGVGITRSNKIREEIYDEFTKLGFVFPCLVHHSAWISPSARAANGVQIMAGAIIQADVMIGENSIVNTGAKVDHDSIVGAHSHIAPGLLLPQILVSWKAL
jgi:sugar O-acyltransferase (sialic acid O-acetyltransferase NeuD family)